MTERLCGACGERPALAMGGGPRCSECHSAYYKALRHSPRPCNFPSCAQPAGRGGGPYCTTHAGHGHASHVNRLGANAARELWARGVRWTTINVQPRRAQPVRLYGGLTPTGPAAAKFGVTSRSLAARWSEYPEQYGTLLLPLFTTEEAAVEHHDLEAMLRTTVDIAAGFEWVDDILAVYKAVEESDLLVGRLKLWTPPATWRPTT